jgi:ABC-type multidrug transport system ATPase subunit
MTDVIRTEALTKTYGDVVAVDGLDLTVAEGDLYGFLGPNGSGKTTTVRMLLGLVYPSSGRIELLGHDVPRQVQDALPHVGALVEGPAFYPHLSGRRNLTVHDAAGRGGPRRTRAQRVGDVLEQVGLVGAADRPVKGYSLGMRQRLGIAAALLRRPRLLVLDEPTNGLDPAGIREVRDLLLALHAGGTTVFLSSHLLAEVEQLCTRAGIVHRGRLVAERDVASLLAPTGRVWIDTPDVDAARTAIGTIRGPRLLGADGGGISVHVNGTPVADVVRRLVEDGVRVGEVLVHRPTLEEVYLELTGGASEAGVDEVRRS